MKCYKLEELLSFYLKYSTNDTNQKQSHLLRKKTITSNQSLFLNGLQGQIPQNNHELINSQKDKKNRVINFGNHIFNINVNNLPEIIEKVIKEKTNVIMQNNLFMEFNKDKKHEKYYSHIAEVALFFQENNLNFLNLCEMLATYNSNLREEKSTSFMFVLSKVKSTVNIKRDQVSMETINQNKSYFFILQGEESELNIFIEDSKTISSAIYDNKQDEELISYLAKKRISIFLNKEEPEKQIPHHKEKTEDKGQMNIVSTSSRASERSILTLNYLDNKTKSPSIFENIAIPNDSPYVKRFKVTRILPEANQIGLLLINKKGEIEFKPFLNNYKGYSLLKNIGNVQGIVRYRYLYKYKALNIFFYNSKRTKIFVFDDESQSIEVYDYIKANAVNIDPNFDDIKYHTNLWINGFICNYEYLLYLNHMSSRSFSDLSQYPIMPWVIANYNDVDEIDLTDEKNYRDFSKPIAALNPKKAEKSKESYLDIKEMMEEKFQHGTHYSNPAHTSYYLIRSSPLFHLRLQNKFDSADRLFYKIKESWSIINTYGDYKELIPE